MEVRSVHIRLLAFTGVFLASCYSVGAAVSPPDAETPATTQPASPKAAMDVAAEPKAIKAMLRDVLGRAADDLTIRVEELGYTRVTVSGSVPDEQTREQIKKLITSRVKR